MMPVRHVMLRFADQTTMHGVPKAIHARSTVSRIFWSVICVAAGTMFCMQMSEVLTRYFSYPKKVTVEVVPTPVPFPSVSLCNMRHLDFYILNTLNRKFLEDFRPINHINTSTNPFVQEYMKTVARYGELWYKYQGKYPLIFQDVFSRTTFSSNIPEDIISLAGVQLNEFIVNCYFAGSNCGRETNFERFFDPYYFNCFTYTAPRDQDGNVQSLSEGIENGWSAIVLTGSGMLDNNSDIRILPGLHESRSAVSASEGIRIVIHPPNTDPFPFTEGYDVPPGFSASLGIKPRRNIRIGPPYGKCTDTDPFGSSTKLYRGIKCQKMCQQSHVIKECDCYDVSLPKLPGITVPPCRRSDQFPDSCMFNATDECLQILLRLNDRVQCARATHDKVNRNTSLMIDCNCFPACDEVFYDISYSLSKWPASGYEGDAAYHDVFYIGNFRERFEDTPKYNTVTTYFTDENRERTMRDFARLNVYVADSNVIKTEETPGYETNQLVSDIGGQLGLWVGISIITITEVFELCFDLFRCLCSGEVKNRRSSLRAGVGTELRNGKYKPAPSLDEGFYYADPPHLAEGIMAFSQQDTSQS